MIAIVFLALGSLGTVCYLLYFIFFGQVNPQQLDKTVVAGDNAVVAGKLSDAESLYKQAAADAQSSDNSLLLADVLMKLGSVDERQQKMPEAEGYLRQAAQVLSERIKTAGAGGFSTTVRKHMLVQAQLANILRDRKCNDEAAQLYKQALEDCQQDPDSTDQARISLDYAHLLRTMGKPSEAELLEAKIEASDNVSHALQNGETQFNQQNFVKAEAFYRAGLADSEARHDGDGSARACLMIALCELYCGNYQEVVNHCRRCENLASTTNNDNSRSWMLSGAHTVLALIGEVQGRHQDAQDTLDEGLQLSSPSVGDALMKIWTVVGICEDKPRGDAFKIVALRAVPRLPDNVAGQVLQVVACHCQHQRDFKAADDLYNQALARYIKVGDLNMQSATLYSLGDDCSLQNKFAEAEPYYRKALEYSIKVKNDSMSASAWWHIADCLFHFGKRAEAHEAFERSYQLAMKANGPASVSVGNVLYCLGNLEKADGKYDQALQHYLAAIPIYETSTILSRAEHADLLRNAGQCCTKMGRQVEADQYQKRALALQ